MIRQTHGSRVCLILLILISAAACANYSQTPTAVGVLPDVTSMVISTQPVVGTVSIEMVTPMVFVTPGVSEMTAAPDQTPLVETAVAVTPDDGLVLSPTVSVESGTDPLPDTPVELTWRMRSANDSEIAIYEQISREIDADSAELDLTFEVGSYGYATNLQQQILAGGGPDVFWLSGSQIGDFVRRGFVHDLGALAGDSAEFDQSRYFPGPMAHLTRDPVTQRTGGHLWGVPRDVSTLVLYINRDLIRDAGADDPRQLSQNGQWNWTTFRELARSVNDLGEDVYGIGQYSWWGTHGYWIHAAGGEYWNDEGKCGLNSAATREGLTFEQSLYADGLAAPIGSQPDRLFTEGKLGMYLTGRWVTPRMREEIDFNWDVVELPAGPTGEFNFMFWGAYVVNRRSESPEAAWRLIEALTSSDVQNRLVDSGMTLPGKLNTESTARFLAATPPENNRAFLNGILETNRAEAPLWQGNWSQWDGMVINGIDKVLNAQLSPAEFAATICQEAGWALGQPANQFRASR